MTMEQFNKLKFDDKLYLVVDKGVFVDNYVTKDIRINCYAMHKFFVELVYNPITNKITEIKSFDSGADLDKYINLSKFKF
jgi:hypothetical protein